MWVLEVVVLMYLCHSTYLALSFLHLHLYIIFFLGKFKSTIIDALRIFVAIIIPYTCMHTVYKAFWYWLETFVYT